MIDLGNLQQFTSLEAFSTNLGIDLGKKEVAFQVLPPSLRILDIDGPGTLPHKRFIRYLPRSITWLRLHVDVEDEAELRYLPPRLRALYLPKASRLTNACFSTLPKSLDRLLIRINGKPTSIREVAMFLSEKGNFSTQTNPATEGSEALRPVQKLTESISSLIRIVKDWF